MGDEQADGRAREANGLAGVYRRQQRLENTANGQETPLPGVRRPVLDVTTRKGDGDDGSERGRRQALGSGGAACAKAKAEQRARLLTVHG